MNVAGQIEPDEDLGRRLYSRSSAKRARRSRVPHTEFMPKATPMNISVDRISMADQAGADISNIARVEGASRPGSFRGWAFIANSIAGRNGRKTMASPTRTNPYHGEIILPEMARDDKDERTRHAQELADASQWREARSPDLAAVRDLQS